MGDKCCRNKQNGSSQVNGFAGKERPRRIDSSRRVQPNSEEEATGDVFENGRVPMGETNGEMLNGRAQMGEMNGEDGENFCRHEYGRAKEADSQIERNELNQVDGQKPANGPKQLKQVTRSSKDVIATKDETRDLHDPRPTIIGSSMKDEELEDQFVPPSPTQEPIFPSELQVRTALMRFDVTYENKIV